jgi:hypothetical protein
LCFFQKNKSTKQIKKTNQQNNHFPNPQKSYTMGGKSSRPKTLESLVGAGDLVDYDAERVPKRCYWDIVKEDRQGNPVEMGRVEFLLYQDTPLTSKNFGANCSGFKLEEPVVNRAGKSITVSVYSGVTFHRIIPKFMCQVCSFFCYFFFVVAFIF